MTDIGVKRCPLAAEVAQGNADRRKSGQGHQALILLMCSPCAGRGLDSQRAHAPSSENHDLTVDVPPRLTAS